MAPSSSPSADDCLSLYNALLAVVETPGVKSSLLKELLEENIDQLKKLLDIPPKSEASHTKVKSGELTTEEGEFQINEVFIQEAIQLSDDFNIDEVEAARLLLRGQKESQVLDRNAFQSAIFLFHTRRQNILESLRLILSYALNEEIDPEIRRAAKQAANLLASPKAPAAASGSGSFTEKCISSMASVRSSVQQLREKERHEQTLRLIPTHGFKEDLEVQVRFLMNQHEALASIVFYLVKLKRATVSDFKNLLGVVKSFEKYDIFTFHHILPLYSFCTVLCDQDSPINFQQTVELHKHMLNEYKSAPWPLRSVQASVQIWWLSEFNGLCNDPSSAEAPDSAALDYFTHVFSPSKAALEDGAFEFMLAVSADVSAEWYLNSAKEDLHRFLQTRVAPLEDNKLLSVPFKSLVIGQFEIFIECFISNMADLLKQMKTQEEEDALLTQRTCGYDLERFYMIIHYTYLGRRNAGMVFWVDPESNLHGFIVWASTSHMPFMVATFSYMLASLAFGATAAEQTHRFLQDEITPGSRKNRRTQYLSWEQLFKEFQKYIEQLRIRQKALVPTNSYRTPAIPVETVTEPPPESSMMLDGYLRLIAQVTQESPASRHWLLHESPNFRIVVALFDLLALQASVQLWDSVFSAITAFLTEKTENLNSQVWIAIDNWALGTPAPPSNALQLGSMSGKPFAQAGASEKLDAIVTAVHPAEAFARLMATLVSPPVEDSLLKDSLPFPEILGSSTRLSGIDPYVDFIVGTIDDPTARLTRAQYRIFRPVLQSSCLEFIENCLINFNEDLLNIASSNVAVDVAIGASSLEAYAKLHPFARVMEQLLTEKCFNVLYEIIKIGVEDLASAGAPMPTLRTILMTINILDLAMRMQSTYFEVVRPLVKRDESGMRKMNTISTGFPSVEEAILHHLDIVVCLGLYVGSAYQDVTLAALSLLEKLSVAPKLVSTMGSSLGQQARKNRLLGAIEQSPESNRILFNLIQQWEADVDNEEADMRYPQKFAILKLLDSSLASQPNDFTLAHMLLGFGWDEKEGISLSVSSGGIGSGVSLLHSLLADVDARESDEAGLAYDGGLCRLKNDIFSVLKRLWKSPATSAEVLYVLRANKLLFSQMLSEQIVQRQTVWDGIPFESDEFFTRGAAASFCNFIGRRTSLFNYIALEIRQLSTQGASTGVSKYLSTLLGKTVLDGQSMTNLHILDLLDFLELDAPESIPMPKITWFNDVNLSAFYQDDPFGNPSYHLPTIDQILLLKRNELGVLGVIDNSNDDSVTLEMKALLDYLFAENQLRLFKGANLECLKAWSTLIAVMLEDCEYEPSAKTLFLLTALQSILPKLESYCSGDIAYAQELSSLAHTLTTHLTFDSKTFGKGRASDMANDRMYQLFRISLRCIQSPMATANLREDFYNIAYRYLKGMSDLSIQTNGLTRHNTQTIKTSGDRLLEVLCNDAYAGEGQCKIVALLLLETLVGLAADEGSSYVIDTLMRQNFIVVITDSLKRTGHDLRNTTSKDIDYLMRSFKATTGFLVRVSQTRIGSGYVINAGLFQALRESHLFAADPDLGVGINSPTALRKYYDLLQDAMRVVTCAILSKGPQNQTAIKLGRQFITENRNVMMTVFKRHAGIGGQRVDDIGDLGELVALFVLLISVTSFIEGEERSLH
ncbi:hypothetical protein C7212DRAFT_302801 [Tuber magnatum]|uniref:Nucleoporin Nup186/Nup192/Nup205 n=1 Tax=Tuber magnatum TaxID=42249 RepID=A0A317SC88_9PEZI|nr:hypothetical protein C7212DRAFT_302801 [Tuber magnatum]